jgi:hypothetical protein
LLRRTACLPYPLQTFSPEFGSWGSRRSKVLVANRAEIAVWAFRAACELGVETVAVYPWEDRGPDHRLKADEAYETGARGHPVRAYLTPTVIVETAFRAGGDAVYPAYGFRFENPELADASDEALRARICDDAVRFAEAVDIEIEDDWDADEVQRKIVYRPQVGRQ